MRRIFGRVGTVTAAQAVAAGITEVTFRADPPTGGWQPGQEIALWVREGIARHYTASRVEGADRFAIVADLYSEGPGAHWLAQAEPGTQAHIAANQHKDRRLAPGRAALLGDASAIGLLHAIRKHRAPAALLIIETPGETVNALRGWAPDIEFVARDKRARRAAAPPDPCAARRAGRVRCVLPRRSRTDDPATARHADRRRSPPPRDQHPRPLGHRENRSLRRGIVRKSVQNLRRWYP